MKTSLLATLLLLLPSSLRADPITFAFPDSYAPLVWNDAGRIQGIGVDVLSIALKEKMGLEVVYKSYPWARAQEEVRKGYADAFVTVPTPVRLEYTVCSKEPLTVLEIGVYTYVDHPRRNELLQIKSYEELADFVLVEYRGNDWTRNKADDLNVIWADTLAQTYRLLAAKRGDIVVRNNFNFDYFMKNSELRNQIEKMPGILASLPLHLCIGKGSEYLSVLPAFDQAISELREEGIIEAIISEYGNGTLSPDS
ncbi:transporter substrate-binding domain-containing protein [Kiloniella laminariae]|uniref:Transporter substrate-binding domain-containing protein n=1 Tax=Kiloniella laminariae TaxID=454162 RepID=A0ABT4LGQ3_9PROT|nr:transporter substrate-binding domain-containing protein [Kiloniella laminariae]MCZ4280277.1 transporter substrate-binding domain-containing protein [Kiloniella laminariae]